MSDRDPVHSQSHIGSLPVIDSLQVHSGEDAARFLPRWKGDYWSLRWEPFTPASESGPRWIVDAWLSTRTAPSELFLLFGILVEANGHVFFPNLSAHADADTLGKLSEDILSCTGIGAPMSGIRLSDTSSEALATLTRGRAIPGLCPTITAVNHLRRYLFAQGELAPSSVLDCACGAGYGAPILARDASTSYVGVDIDSEAIAFAKRIAARKSIQFERRQLNASNTEYFQNIVCLETLEHVSDPSAFVELLISKLAPTGRLILSVPTEEWAGSHRNPEHLTNWNFTRFERFVANHFANAIMHKQQLSFIQSNPFEHSQIFDRPANPRVDETLIAVLWDPRPHPRPHRVVVKRSHAMGDVVWTTPVVAAIRRENPESTIAVVTRHTQVYHSNPDADIVATPAFSVRPSDTLVDLDGAYERKRDAHIVEAYFGQANIRFFTKRPALYPAAMHFEIAARHIHDRFREARFKYLVSMHPAASSPDRIWPGSHWQDLISIVAGPGDVGIVLVGDGADYSAEVLGVLEDKSVVSFVRRTDLLTTAAAIALTDVLVAPDSGLSHVANAVGTQSVILFGMADPSTRLPLDGSGTAIWSPVPCRGCLSRMPPEALPICPLGTSICMEQISANEVHSVMARSLQKSQPFGWHRKLRGLGIPINDAREPSSHSESSEAKVDSFWSRLRSRRR